MTLQKLIAILFATILLNACNSSHKIIGTGDIITAQITVNNFTKVISDLPADIEIYVSKDTPITCTVMAQKNIAELITGTVKEDELLLSIKNNYSYRTDKNITIKITCPTLSSIKGLGSGNIMASGSIVSNEFVASQMGSGDITLTGATIGSLRVMVAGSGDIAVNNGTSQQAEYGVKGSGSIEAFTNICSTVKAKVDGSGDIDIFATGLVDAEVNGSGNINYKGTTQVKNKVNGSGEIIAQ
jgi:hypothetical protein